MQPVIRDASAELARAICANFGADIQVTVEEITCREWASVTFTGARHALSLQLEGADAGSAADAFLSGLADREFVLRGHILADIALIAEERRDDGAWVCLQLEALTVEES